MIYVNGTYYWIYYFNGIISIYSPLEPEPGPSLARLHALLQRWNSRSFTGAKDQADEQRSEAVPYGGIPGIPGI